ncbi:outer membrane protein [Phreatobacter oligotrophus]|uniref:outer membrane protein n=1 Tax=Phreatobacter oligotrophus TaxID=1122261 RepID=UPI002356CB04|nr:outer membrane beta-barrel protein [Phreatobacter oligotrophus]MBX9991511.1 outer membrane beta-barrel protein [Phreatobacter oligotrophus]
MASPTPCLWAQMLRLSFLSGVALCALLARDATAQPLPAPAANWTGAYAGGVLGVGVASNRWTDVNTGFSSYFGASQSRTISATGPLFGAFAGHNWQVSPNLVVGVEGDLTVTTGSGGSRSQFNGDNLFVTRPGFVGSLRARAGLPIDRLLLYVTGGIGFGQVNTSAINQAALGSPTLWAINQTRVGWTAGGGVEYLVSRYWSFRLEALYTDLGSARLTSLPGAINPTKFMRVRSSHTQVRTGFAYRF